MDVINARQMEKGNYVTLVQFRAVRRMDGMELGSVVQMASYRQVKNVNNGTDFVNDVMGNGKL